MVLLLGHPGSPIEWCTTATCLPGTHFIRMQTMERWILLRVNAFGQGMHYGSKINYYNNTPQTDYKVTGYKVNPVIK